MARFKSIAKWSAPGIALILAAVPLAQINAQQDEPKAGDAVNGKQLFTTAMCGVCHSLADADAAGGIGPSFDYSPNLSRDHIVNVVTNGVGAMPPYSGQLSAAEIEDVTAYILSAAAK